MTNERTGTLNNRAGIFLATVRLFYIVKRSEWPTKYRINFGSRKGSEDGMVALIRFLGGGAGVFANMLQLAVYSVTDLGSTVSVERDEIVALVHLLTKVGLIEIEEEEPVSVDEERQSEETDAPLNDEGSQAPPQVLDQFLETTEEELLEVDAGEPNPSEEEPSESDCPKGGGPRYEERQMLEQFAQMARSFHFEENGTPTFLSETEAAPAPSV